MWRKMCRAVQGWKIPSFVVSRHVFQIMRNYFYRTFLESDLFQCWKNKIAFVEIRKTISLQSAISQQIMDLKNDLEQRLGEHDVQLMEIYTVMEQFLDEKTEQKNWENRKRLGYK